jgi:hypothetical protein
MFQPVRSLGLKVPLSEAKLFYNSNLNFKTLTILCIINLFYQLKQNIPAL